MVQELKGNIRVFCRVRPVLRSDILSSSTTLVASTSAEEITDGTASPDPEQEAKMRDEAMAQLAYPDRLDHKEIVVSSSSESATGQERKGEWQFTFDKVSQLGGHLIPFCVLKAFPRYLNHIPARPRSSRRSRSSHRAAPMGTMSACLPMARQAPASPSLWRVDRYVFNSTRTHIYAHILTNEKTESTAGMIPRAVEQVFRVADELKTKGWQYKMEGQFLEIVCPPLPRYPFPR